MNPKDAAGNLSAPAPIKTIHDYKLGDRVRVLQPGSYLGKTGEVIQIGNKSKLGGTDFKILTTDNGSLNFNLHEMEHVKTQVLYAYTDKTSEVHWATKVYSAAELKRFKFTPAPTFNKSIELT